MRGYVLFILSHRALLVEVPMPILAIIRLQMYLLFAQMMNWCEHRVNVACLCMQIVKYRYFSNKIEEDK